MPRPIAACIERCVWFSLVMSSLPLPWQVVFKFHHNCNFSGSVFLGFFFIHLSDLVEEESCCT
jgi:hypothetical protein